ncbi:MAG: hypothetical protein KJP23_13180 [Deltaproteobacteria bacterium]|nr:hypothetical protein [Deltaproteobacteria bacterium]
MDFEGFFRNKIENMLITASWVEQVQKMLELKRVSQVWGDRPEWYIWIDGAPGAYSLVFQEGETIKAANRTLALGQFAVKCYPYAGATVFDAFSPQEREMLTSDLFDHTHTPRLETRSSLPEAFFTVGSVTLMLDAAETVAMFTFDSLDFLRWSTFNPKIGQKYHLNHAQEKKIVRNIPGWLIGYPLFDRLVSMFAFYSKKSPAFIGATRSPGFECVIDLNQIPANQACDQIQHWSTSVLFSSAADTDALINTVWRAQLDSKEKIVYEQNLGHPVDNSKNEFDQEPPVAINPLWWELAQSNLKSELASTCGCCSHEHHTYAVR